MITNIFAIREVIVIVMNLVDKLENYQMYGFDDETELDISKPLKDKLESLDSDQYENFIKICSEISEEILSIKSGELNELNYCHEEIIFLAQKRLKEYIKNN